MPPGSHSYPLLLQNSYNPRPPKRNMQVIKNSGKIEPFNQKKIKSSILEAGGSEEIAKETVLLILKRKKETMHTRKILSIVLKNLKKEKGVAQKYNLKYAIMQMGPHGFIFEQYFAQILSHYGYKTKVGQHLRGKKIMQEVDIVATKKKKYMIECKYHNDIGTITRLHPALYTYSRFLDLKKHGFEKSWLATNTKCSMDARNYSIGVNQKVTSWEYPKKQSLRELIEKKQLYPLTILATLSHNAIQSLFSKNIMILSHLCEYSDKEIKKITKLPTRRIKKIRKEIKEILSSCIKSKGRKKILQNS